MLVPVSRGGVCVCVLRSGREAAVTAAKGGWVGNGCGLTSTGAVLAELSSTGKAGRRVCARLRCDASVPSLCEHVQVPLCSEQAESEVAQANDDVQGGNVKPDEPRTEAAVSKGWEGGGGELMRRLRRERGPVRTSGVGWGCMGKGAK